MSIQPKKKMNKGLGYFEDSGTGKKTYPLITAAYYDRLETARKIIETDPEQINQQDPHSGLTAFHIAIFRQNVELVELLAQHPRTNAGIKDTFNRRAVDMLDYTTNQSIFHLVMTATYPELMLELEQDSETSVVAFKPKPSGP